MSKIDLQETNSGYNLQKINNNFTKIAAEFNNKVLYRDNPPGEPNEMLDPLDMNGHKIYNLGAPSQDHEAARLKDVRDALAGAMEAKFVGFDPTPSISATNVQAAIEELSRGYLDLGDYEAGLVIDSMSQSFWVGDMKYIPSKNISLPYTTTGVWAVDGQYFFPLTVSDTISGNLEDGEGALSVNGAVFYVNHIDDLLNIPPVHLNFGQEAICHGSMFKWNGSQWRAQGPINVKVFGAVGNGVVDDSDAIIRGILYATNGTLYFPRGTYSCSQQLFVLNPINIIGEEKETTSIICTSTEPATTLSINGVSNFYLSNITIVGNGVFPGGHAIRMNNVQNSILRDFKAINGGSYNLGMQGGNFQNIFIENFYLNNSGADALDIKNNSNNNFGIYITNGIVRNFGMKTTGTSVGIDCRGPVFVDNVNISNFGAGTASHFHAIQVREGESANPNGEGGHWSVLTNIQVSRTQGSATKTGISLEAYQCVVSNFIIRDCTVGVGVRQSDNNISNGTIINTPVGILIQDVGYATNPDRTNVSNINIRGASSFGIRVFTSNNIFSNFIINNSNVGLKVEGPAGSNNFINGTITNTTTPMQNSGPNTRIFMVRPVADQ